MRLVPIRKNTPESSESGVLRDSETTLFSKTQRIGCESGPNQMLLRRGFFARRGLFRRFQLSFQLGNPGFELFLLDAGF